MEQSNPCFGCNAWCCRHSIDVKPIRTWVDQEYALGRKYQIITVEGQRFMYKIYPDVCTRLDEEKGECKDYPNRLEYCKTGPTKTDLKFYPDKCGYHAKKIQKE
jgi:hypothetical protein